MPPISILSVLIQHHTRSFSVMLCAFCAGSHHFLSRGIPAFIALVYDSLASKVCFLLIIWVALHVSKHGLSYLVARSFSLSKCFVDVHIRRGALFHHLSNRLLNKFDLQLQLDTVNQLINH